MKNKLYERMLSYGILLFVGFLLIYRFAEGTTPLRPDAYVWDSGIFQTVGKLWAEGMVPYQEVFDHKGPLLFFIQRIAYAFSEPKLALYCIESLVMGLNLCLIHCIFSLRYRNLSSLLLSLVTALFWIPALEYGNLTEEYSMPFILLALYFQLLYIKSEKIEHPVSYAFLYGLAFGCLSLIRINNGALLLVGVGVIGLQLLTVGKWKNILYNVLAFVIGIVSVYLPFLLYFHYHQAVGDMLYATFVFNFLYAGEMTSVPSVAMLKGILHLITPALLCIGAGVLSLCNKKIISALFLLVGAVGTLYVTLSGNSYAHYFMLMVPLIPLAFVLWPTCACKGYQAIGYAMCVVFVAFTLYTTGKIIPQKYITNQPTINAQNKERKESWQSLVAQIPQHERNQVAAYGIGSNDTTLFITNDIQPMGKYIMLMQWHAKADATIATEYYQMLQEGTAKWVVAKEEQDLSALTHAYERVDFITDNEGTKSLWKRK